MASGLMSVKDVAEYLSIHRMTAYKLANTGELPGFKIGGQWRFQKDVLDAWIAEGANKATLAKGTTVKRKQRDTAKQINELVRIYEACQDSSDSNEEVGL